MEKKMIKEYFSPCGIQFYLKTSPRAPKILLMHLGMMLCPAPLIAARACTSPTHFRWAADSNDVFFSRSEVLLPPGANVLLLLEFFLSPSGSLNPVLQVRLFQCRASEMRSFVPLSHVFLSLMIPGLPMTQSDLWSPTRGPHSFRDQSYSLFNGLSKN